jgi:hypothetical protein
MLLHPVKANRVGIEKKLGAFQSSPIVDRSVGSKLETRLAPQFPHSNLFALYFRGKEAKEAIKIERNQNRNQNSIIIFQRQ